MNINKESILNKVEKVTYLTPASTVVLVSTKSEDGVNNVAPFGMFMLASTTPPMVLVGISPKADTHRNIVATKEFVVSIPKASIVDAIYAAGEKFPAEVDEFQHVDLTPYKSNLVKAPRVSECLVNMECTLAWYKNAGDHTIFCGNVIDADIDEGVFSDGITSLDLRKHVSQIYHITRNAFMVDGKVVLAKKEY